MLAGLVARASRELHSHLGKRVRGGVVELTVASYVGAAIGLATSIVATRLTSPAEYGAAALLMSFPSLLWSFAGFKPSSIATRYIVRYRAAGQHNHVLSISKLGYMLDLFTSTAVLGVIVLCSQWVMRSVYGLTDRPWLVIAFAASLPLFSLIGTSQAIFSAWQAFRWFAAFLLLERVLTLLFTVSLLLGGWSVTGLVIAVAVAQATTGIMSALAAAWLLARDGAPAWWSARIQLVGSLRSELTAMFSWNYLLSTLSGAVAQIPLMILGRVSGADAAGYYRLGLTIATVTGYIEQSLAKVAYPRLVAQYSGARKDYQGAQLRRWTLRAGVPAALLVLAGIAILPVAVPYVFGEAYLPVVLGTQILLGPVAVRSLFFWLAPHYYASGQLKRYTLWYLLYTVITITLCWVVAPSWGYTGVAIVSAGSYMLLLAALSITVGVQLPSHPIGEKVVQ